MSGFRPFWTSRGQGSRFSPAPQSADGYGSAVMTFAAPGVTVVVKAKSAMFTSVSVESASRHSDP